MKALKKAVSVVLSLVIVFSVFTIVPFTASAEAETYVDTIDGYMLAKNVQGYYEWEDVKKGDYSKINSPAVYNGRTAYEWKNDTYTFKLKKSDGSIYTTESGGNVKNVTATWVNNNADRTLLIYGKDTPYTSYSELYSEDSRGDLIGSLAFTTTGDSTLSLTVNGNYPYIGFAVDSATIYLEELKIEWTTGCVVHDWETEWSWTPEDGDAPGVNNTSAVMTATCTACGETQTVNGVVEQTDYSEATCVSEGNVRYTATAEHEGKTYSSTKDYTLPKSGHNISYVSETAPKYENGEYINGAQAHYECSVCHKIFAEETAETELDSVPVVPYFTFEMKSGIVLTGYNGNDEEVIIPKKVPESYLAYDPDAQELIDSTYGVEEIAADAFKDHTEIKKISTDKFIQYVGKSAFEGCTSLTSVQFAEGVGTIKANAFDNCSSLESLAVGYLLRDGIDSPNFEGTPDNLTFIGAHVAGIQKSKLMLAAESFGKQFEITDEHVYGDSYYVLDGDTVEEFKSCVACDDTSTANTYSVEKHEGVAETCLTEGNIEYYETTSGEKLYFTAKKDATHENEMALVSTDDLIIPAHTLTHVDYKAADKLTDGNIEYWYCEKCNKYYKEENGEKIEITKAQTVIPMTLRKLEAGQVYELGEHFAYPTDKATKNKYGALHGYQTTTPYFDHYVTFGSNHLNMSNGWDELAIIFGASDKVFANLFYVTYSDGFELGAVYYNANVAPQVKWSDDGKTVTFTMKNFYRTQRNYDNYESFTYNLTKTVDVVDTVIPATCTEKGKTEHKAVLRQGNYTYEAVRYEDIENDPPTGEHTYGEPSWEWADDCSSATATFTCSGCGDTVTLTDEDIIVSETVPTEPGTSERTFSAEVEFENTPYSTSKTENIRYRSVTWKNYDGEVLQFEPVVEDGKPHAYNGETPVRPSDDDYDYTFDAWESGFDENENYVYTASFKQFKHYCTVTWKNFDGTELEKDENVPGGTTPEYNGETPLRESTVEKDFTFSGWSPEVSEVTDDIVYTAQFSESPRGYTVIWKDEDGSVLETDEKVPYGTIPTYNGNTPTKESSDEVDFTFSGWTPEITTVTGDAVYTAAYTTDSLPAWKRLQRSINNATNGSVIQLTEDCVATNNDVALVIPTDKVITIDLNGHAINRNLNSSKAGGNVITNNGTLTITDTSEEQTGAVKGGYNNNNTAGILNTQGSTFTLAGGAVTGNRTDGTGGGAGIANAGTMYMTGGTVSNNKVYGTGKNGGGIYNLGTLSISGGTITGNYTQTGNGGGIYFQTTRTLNISGSPVIIGNTCGNSSFKSNDLYLERNAAQAITVTGPLDSSAKIGIREKTKATGEAFTKNLAGNGTVDNFISDYDDVAIRINSAGEAYTAKLYTVNLSNTENGTISADKTKATAGETVTLTAEPNNGYKLAGISVKDASNHDVTVNGNQFTMPASDVTVTASFEQGNTHIYGHSISLGGDISVNFYMELSDQVISSQNDPYMLFTVPDTSLEYQTQKVFVKNVTPVKIDGKDYYIFKCRVAAKDMTAQITAKLVDGEEGRAEYTYSVKEYADYLLEHAAEREDWTKAAGLVKAMLNYGANAQVYFNKNAENLANAGLIEEDKVLGDVSIDIAAPIPGNLPEGTSFEGASLSLKSETTLSLYFKSSGKLIFSCDGYDVETVKSGDYQIARIRGIKAANIGDVFTLSVNDTNVKYSPLNYCEKVLEDDTQDERLVNVVKALVLYWQAAKSYFA